MASSLFLSWENLSSLSSHYDWFLNTLFVFLVIGTLLAGLYLACKIYASHKKAQRRIRWASVGKDVVILHQSPRSKLSPSTSPFPLKLETYLRMGKIPYQNDFEEWYGPKGKTPWITINGEHIADSQLCLEFLANKFQKDFSAHLSPEEQAVARAIRIMGEDHLYWTGVYWRWVRNKGKGVPTCLANTSYLSRTILIPLLARKYKKAAEGQGTGRHTEAEVYQMAIQDLQAISLFLGTKPFFMGEKPTEVDCTMFGLIGVILWDCPGSPLEQFINSKLSNLVEYTIRMKTTFWPDWDQCLTSSASH